MIELFDLEQFVTFAECGTLSKTAELLYTSQPSVTRSMKNMEEELGISLFTRRKNRLELNETGKQAAVYAKQVLDSMSLFKSQTLEFERKLHTVSIGFCSQVPQLALTPAITAHFRDMTLQLEMKSDEFFLNRLLDGYYQFAVMHYAPESDLFFTKKIGHEDLYLSVMPSHPLAVCTSIRLSDLKSTPILVYDDTGFWRHHTDKKTANFNYIYQNDISSMDRLKESSNLPYFTSSYLIDNGEAEGNRIHIPIEDMECHVDYYLVCLKETCSKYEELFHQLSI